MTKSKWYARPVYVLVALVLVLGLTLIPTVTDAGLDGSKVVRLSVWHFPQSIASGDPRSDSVVLWTRVVDDELPGQDLMVNLTVATDKHFRDIIETQELVARAEYDNCVKVRIDGLDSYTFYYYRFTYDKGKFSYCSKTGRTKTAPAPGDNVPVRWAFFTGQNFPGRYYNSFAHLLNTYYNTGENDLDFLVHTGDYVYETTGGSAPRVVQFQDTAGAIELGEPGNFAAKSLSNYRDLYKTYRSDEMLQRLHEKYPMIVIWDDHEYSDDNWQDVATYFAGRVDERDPVRKQNAERAFFEYMPIEVGLGASDELNITEDILYPNSRVYRNFSYGDNVDLIMTDYRTYRPDHLIPEDAFPATIVMDEATTEWFLGGPGTGIEPYINIDAPEFAELKANMIPIMTWLYKTENEFFNWMQAAQKAAEVVTGNLSARYINGVFEAVGYPKPFNDAALAAMPRGIAFLTMGKMDLYSQWGSRYMVSQDLCFVYATYLNMVDPDVDEAYGATQENWFEGILDSSTANWKIFVSSVSAVPMMLDFSNPNITPLLPPGFPWTGYRIQLDSDQWDGFPVKKNEMLNYLSTVPGAVIISGDIHASFVGDHGDRGGVNRVYEFTTPSVSSSTIEEEAAAAMAELGLEGVPVELIGYIFQISSIGNPISKPSEVVWTDCNQNGYTVMEATEDALTATYHLYPTEFVHDNFYDNFTDLEGEFTSTSFRIEEGELTQLP